MPTTSLPETAAVRKIASGKVRDLYTHPTAPSTALVFVASDRISAFDVVLTPGIPDKGALLTLMSAHWFATLPSLVSSTAVPLKHHLLAVGVPAYDGLDAALSATQKKELDARTMQVRRMEVIPLEAIVRGYLTGSAWAEYAAHGTVHGIPLPAGLQKSQRMPDGPLFTPSTKAPPGQHDENIHPDTAAALVGPAVAEKVKALALAVYAAAADYAEARGIIIADTKFEFGLDEESGDVVLVDEVLTPDSSRFWDKEKYKVGCEQESFDKQLVRDWLAKEGLKGKEGVQLPDDVVQATAERYKTVFEKLTGKTFEEASA